MIVKLLYIVLFFILSFTPTLVLSQVEKIGGGKDSSVIVTTSSHEPAQFGENTLSGVGLLPNLNAASRFLGHATLGADYETIDSVSQVGFSNWLDAQLNMPYNFSHLDYLNDLVALGIDSIIANGGDSSDYYFDPDYWRFAWWKYVMDEPDLVRARVALALSEIFVISEIPDLDRWPMGLADWYDMLCENAFGNYRDLLETITKHPAMGYYLTHLGNRKTNLAQNRFPDENYAREIMQLFSIGLFLLNPDGTPVLDTAGQIIPTYDNTDIAEFAKIFTGFSFGGAEEFLTNPNNPPDDYLSFTIPMEMYNDEHEPGEKYLLNGFVVPDRDPVNGLADVDDALDNLFAHQNVGPFLARLLIQRLVKSNPGPGYISRVAGVFADNGEGVRGDLKAVVRAILMDPEARDCALANQIYEGMLREPVVRYTNIARAFNASSQDGYYRNTMDRMLTATQQRPLSSPSVFNFFQPNYSPIGPVEDAGLVGPEFQITNSQTTIGYGTRLHRWAMIETDLFEYRRLYSGEQYDSADETVLDLTEEYLLSENGQLNELLERLNLVLCHGNMTPPTRSIIYNATSQIPDSQFELRTRMAIFLTMISPDYLIMR